MGIFGGLLNIAWTFMQETFNVPLSSLGLLLAAGTTGSFIAAFLNGTLLGRMGFGRLILIACLLSASGGFLYAVAPSYLFLLPIALLVYMGRGTLDAGFNNYASQHYNATQMNWLHAMWGLGLTVAPLFMTILIINFDQSWRTGYLLVGMMTLAMAGVIFLTIKQWHIETDDIDEQEPANKRAAPGVRETLQQPFVLLSVLLFFIYGGAEIGTGQLANTLLVDGRGIPQETASLWISFYWGSFTIGRMILGVLAMRFSDGHLLHTGMILSIIGGGLLLSNLGDLASASGLILIGSGYAAFFPMLISQTPARVGRRYAAQVIGFQVGLAGFGGAILPGIAAALADAIGLEVISMFILVVTIVVYVVYLRIIQLEGKRKRSLAHA